MKKHFYGLFGTTKRKVVAALVSGLLVTSLCVTAATAFAADDAAILETEAVQEELYDEEVSAIEPGEDFEDFTSGDYALVKEENGVTLYSLDDGETWTAEKPGGVDWLYDDEKGVYSEDGGETWEAYDDEDWFDSFDFDGFDFDWDFDDEDFDYDFSYACGVTLFKEENGKVLYSSDLGETWSEEFPLDSFILIRESAYNDGWGDELYDAWSDELYEELPDDLERSVL